MLSTTSRCFSEFLEFSVWILLLMIVHKSVRYAQWKLFLCQEPVRSAVIDSCIRVTDNGKASIHRKVWTLENPMFFRNFGAILLACERYIFLVCTFVTIFPTYRGSLFSRSTILPITMISSRWGAFQVIHH